MAVANIISVVGTALTTIGFLQANFPQPTVNYAQIHVAVGLGHQGLQDAGGEEPRTLGFNENKKKIGSFAGFEEDQLRVSMSSSDFQQWRPRIIQNGGFVDQSLKGTGNGGQVTTLQVDAAANSICIAYLSLRWSDGQKFGWLEDLGRACGT